MRFPPMRPRFQREEIVVGDEAFEVYMRDVLECLFGDAEFALLSFFSSRTTLHGS